MSVELWQEVSNGWRRIAADHKADLDRLKGRQAMSEQWKEIAADFQADANRARQDAAEAWVRVKALEAEIADLKARLEREVGARVEAQVINSHLMLSDKIFGCLKEGGKP